MARRRQRVKYNEGQWFAVPLKTGGYALGIIARGNYKTKGGLGYFFGPKFSDLPTKSDTQHVRASDAILITWFGDLGIINGEWPLVESVRPFRREEWPVPKFARLDLIDESRGWLVEYDQNISEFGHPAHERPCEASELAGLPRDVLYGAGAVEIKLTHLLADK